MLEIRLQKFHTDDVALQYLWLVVARFWIFARKQQPIRDTKRISVELRHQYGSNLRRFLSGRRIERAKSVVCLLRLEKGLSLFASTCVQPNMVLVAVQTSKLPVTVLASEGLKASVKAKVTLVTSKIRENFTAVSTL